MADVLSLFDDRVGIVSALLIVLAAVVTPTVARRWQRPRVLVFGGLAALVLIAAVTLVNRGFVSSAGDAIDGLDWWTRHWTAVWSQVHDGLGCWLNVALFVPAGFAWGALTRRPWLTWLGLVVLSFVVETLQGTVLSGAGDPADLLANAVGAAVGTGAAAVWLRRTRTTAPA